jgi:hypothetical protein
VSAAEPLAWTRAFDRGGALDARSDRPPHLSAVAGIAERAIDKMVSEQAAGLADFDAPAHNAAGRRPGAQFWHDFRRAVDAVMVHDDATIDGKARTGEQWAELVAAPARGPRRHRKLIRIGLKVGAHVPQQMLLAEMLIHNRATCLPPLQPFEVEPLWRWVLDRLDERRSR